MLFAVPLGTTLAGRKLGMRNGAQSILNIHVCGFSVHTFENRHGKIQNH